MKGTGLKIASKPEDGAALIGLPPRSSGKSEWLWPVKFPGSVKWAREASQLAKLNMSETWLHKLLGSKLAEP